MKRCELPPDRVTILAEPSRFIRSARLPGDGCVASRRGAFARSTPPNIILIQADDLGYGDLSAYGQAKFATPGIDRLAREGIRFTNYYSGSTVCAPSRAALMTGMHTGHGWIRGNGEIPLRPDDVTVADAAARRRLSHRGHRQVGTRRCRAPPGSRTRRGSTTRSAFSIIATRTASTPIISIATRERVAVDVTRDYVNDLFTREAESVHRAR